MSNGNSLQIEQDKVALREVSKQRRAGLSAAERGENSALMVDFFMDALDFSGGKSDVKSVALYWPIGDEVDCVGLIDRLQAQDIEVGLPCIVGKDRPLVFRVFEGEDKLVEAGFGTRSPRDGAVEIVPDIIGLPLLAFDAKGARLGYGGGFYDHTIEGMQNRPVLVGLAFSAQECDFVPTEGHDKSLDMIVTETGLRRFREESLKV